MGPATQIKKNRRLLIDSTTSTSEELSTFNVHLCQWEVVSYPSVKETTMDGTRQAWDEGLVRNCTPTHFLQCRNVIMPCRTSRVAVRLGSYQKNPSVAVNQIQSNWRCIRQVRHIKTHWKWFWRSPPFLLSIMTATQPYNGLRRKLVLAFDVGTTFSGISYRLISSYFCG